ncbi:hypothetical protein XENORESO_007859 [Xenotaenia resolanae]|uniref:Uncharacterized protein n=1 Tax=Xenotaenia resolanae TaxID=208358 RepID=A0ABV0W1N8_9TELE
MAAKGYRTQPTLQHVVTIKFFIKTEDELALFACQPFCCGTVCGLEMFIILPRESESNSHQGLQELETERKQLHLLSFQGKYFHLFFFAAVCNFKLFRQAMVCRK